MIIEGSAGTAWREETERAIDNVKRTKLDKWMRREWHKAAARDHWSEGRKVKWVEWWSKLCDGAAGHGTRCSLPTHGCGRHYVLTTLMTD